MGNELQGVLFRRVEQALVKRPEIDGMFSSPPGQIDSFEYAKDFPNGGSLGEINGTRLYVPFQDSRSDIRNKLAVNPLSKMTIAGTTYIKAVLTFPQELGGSWYEGEIIYDAASGRLVRGKLFKDKGPQRPVGLPLDAAPGSVVEYNPNGTFKQFTPNKNALVQDIFCKGGAPIKCNDVGRIVLAYLAEDWIVMNGDDEYLCEKDTAVIRYEDGWSLKEFTLVMEEPLEIDGVPCAGQMGLLPDGRPEFGFVARGGEYDIGCSFDRSGNLSKKFSRFEEGDLVIFPDGEFSEIVEDTEKDFFGVKLRAGDSITKDIENGKFRLKLKSPLEIPGLNSPKPVSAKPGTEVEIAPDGKVLTFITEGNAVISGFNVPAGAKVKLSNGRELAGLLLAKDLDLGFCSVESGTWLEYSEKYGALFMKASADFDYGNIHFNNNTRFSIYKVGGRFFIGTAIIGDQAGVKLFNSSDWCEGDITVFKKNSTEPAYVELGMSHSVAGIKLLSEGDQIRGIEVMMADGSKKDGYEVKLAKNYVIGSNDFSFAPQTSLVFVDGNPEMARIFEKHNIAGYGFPPGSIFFYEHIGDKIVLNRAVVGKTPVLRGDEIAAVINNIPLKSDSVVYFEKIDGRDVPSFVEILRNHQFAGVTFVGQNKSGRGNEVAFYPDGYPKGGIAIYGGKSQYISLTRDGEIISKGTPFVVLTKHDNGNPQKVKLFENKRYGDIECLGSDQGVVVELFFDATAKTPKNAVLAQDHLDKKHKINIPAKAYAEFDPNGDVVFLQVNTEAQVKIGNRELKGPFILSFREKGKYDVRLMKDQIVGVFSKEPANDFVASFKHFEIPCKKEDILCFDEKSEMLSFIIVGADRVWGGQRLKAKDVLMMPWDYSIGNAGIINIRRDKKTVGEIKHSNL